MGGGGGSHDGCCCYVLSKCRKTTCILPPCRRKLWWASMPLHLPSLLLISFLLLLLLLLLLVLANRSPSLFSLFVSFVTCSHTLLTHHTLTHSYRSYVVRFCFSPPTRPWFRLQRSFGFGFICANVSSTCAQRSGQL